MLTESSGVSYLNEERSVLSFAVWLSDGEGMSDWELSAAVSLFIEDFGRRLPTPQGFRKGKHSAEVFQVQCYRLLLHVPDIYIYNCRSSLSTGNHSGLSGKSRKGKD